MTLSGFESPGYCESCRLWTMHELGENDEWHCTRCIENLTSG